MSNDFLLEGKNLVARLGEKWTPIQNSWGGKLLRDR